MAISLGTLKRKWLKEPDPKALEISLAEMNKLAVAIDASEA